MGEHTVIYQVNCRVKCGVKNSRIPVTDLTPTSAWRKVSFNIVTEKLSDPSVSSEFEKYSFLGSHAQILCAVSSDIRCLLCLYVLLVVSVVPHNTGKEIYTERLYRV